MVWINHVRLGEEKSLLFPRNIGISCFDSKKIVQKKVYNKKQYLVYLRSHWDDKECFSSLLSDYQVENNIVDRIFLEFDEDDPDERSRKGKIVYYCLKSLGITPYVLFSGGRSYHYHIFFDPVQLDDPKRRIKKWVKGLPIDFLDFQVVGDLRRLTRLPYTCHKSGKMCVIIPNEIFEFSIAKITRITEQLSQGMNEFLDPVFRNNIPLLESLANMKIEKKKISYVKKEIDLEEYPPCIKDIIEEVKSTGELSHVKRFHLAAFMRQTGWKIEEARDFFLRYCSDRSSSITMYHLRRIYGKTMKCYRCENAKIYSGTDDSKKIRICPIGAAKCEWYPSINLYL